MKTSVKQWEQGFDKVITFYRDDIASVRTGRATPALVEDVPVEAYGQKMTVKELASINVPEPRTVVIQPWDKTVLEAISIAIQKSSLGLAPIADGDLIRLNIPSLTEERRREFIKILKRKTEEARIRIRKVREDIHKTFDDLGKDETFRAKENLQKIVDEYNKKIEELEKRKESELMQ